MFDHKFRSTAAGDDRHDKVCIEIDQQLRDLARRRGELDATEVGAPAYFARAIALCRRAGWKDVPSSRVASVRSTLRSIRSTPTGPTW